MAYPGIALVAMVGVGLGLALWYLLADTTNESPHGTGPPPHRDTPSPVNSWEIPSETRRRRRKSTSKVKDDCAICTEAMDHTAATVKCGHIYHLSCIKKWRETQGGGMVTCPLCRHYI